MPEYQAGTATAEDTGVVAAVAGAATAGSAAGGSARHGRLPARAEDGLGLAVVCSSRPVALAGIDTDNA